MKPSRRTFLTLTAASLAAASVPAIAHHETAHHEEKAPRPVPKPKRAWAYHYHSETWHSSDGHIVHDGMMQSLEGVSHPSQLPQFQPNHRK